MGVPLKEIVKELDLFGPVALTENWENVGLLIDPMTDKDVKRILLTNDLTEDVVTEAITSGVGLIITYHPNNFQGLKSISANTWKERIVVQCIKNEIGVFSPRTSWDCAEGGVNDWLADAFNYESIRPIKPVAENPARGSGRVISLRSPITIRTAVDRVKLHLGIQYLRLALGRGKAEETKIRTVALCAGSGASIFKGVVADIYLTGEMSHHDVLDATQNGVSVILCEHSNSERGFLKVIQEMLMDLFSSDISVDLSEVDKDPFTVMC